MSSKALQSLVKRIFADVEFKRRFLASPEDVTSEFHLSSEEKEAVTRVRTRLVLETEQGQVEGDADPLAFWLA